MGKNNNIIEINGVKYNSRTGAALSRPVVNRPTMSDVVRHPAKAGTRHTPKTSHTLMRHAVKKPAPATTRLKAQGHTDTLAKRTAAEVVSKKSAKRIDNKLLSQARRVPKSRLINHFSPVTSDSGSTQSPQLTAVAPAQPLSHANVRRTPAVPAKLSKSKTTADLLEQALRHANSHEQKPFKKPSRRGSGQKRAGLAAASVLSLLAIGGAASQSMPGLRLHMASAKAGFNVGVPDYKPAGYSLKQLNYSAGAAATQFHSNSDDRSYTISQKRSPWDSQALRDSFAAPTDPQYQTVESGGRTVFLYGGGNATWVNGGVWYVIQNNGSLTDHQLVELATSL